MYIENKIQEIRTIADRLENSSELSTEQKLELLDELENLIGENPLLIKYQSIILYNAGCTTEAYEYLAEALKKYSCSYELYELEFEFLRYTSDKMGAFHALSQMYKFAMEEEKRKKVFAYLEDIALSSAMSQNEFAACTELFKKESIAKDYRYFPIDEYGQSVIRLDAFPGRDPNYSYLVNLHKAVQKADITKEDRFHFLYETIRGVFADRKTCLTVNKDDILAVSSAVKTSTYTNLTLHDLGVSPYSFCLEPNVIRYFKIGRSSEVLIEADNDIFISQFKKNVLENKPKLVMQIFIDGLSFQFVKDHGFEQLMPNTYEFFKEGYINNNCHANSEWTLPSLMSMCTGKYTTNHFIYHTEAPHKGEQLNKFIHEYFEETGYMTGRICPNWRGTPSYGYFKAMNRFVYSPMYERMTCGEVVDETIEHLEAFKDFYNYLWMTMEDLHAVADSLSRGVLQDTGIEQYVTENVSQDSEISVFRAYNHKKIEEYKAAIKKVDLYLGIVFDYIRKHYSSRDYVITLNSDHGQRFIEEEDYMFTQKRTNVPFMMAGRNVIHKYSDELMSNVDIFPTLLNICGIPCEAEIDGKLLKDFGGEERDFTISESIFPGQTYKLAMNDKNHLFTFETTENTKNDGLIPIQKYKVGLKNRRTGEDETKKYPEKVESFCMTAFEHSKAWAELYPQNE